MNLSLGDYWLVSLWHLRLWPRWHASMLLSLQYTTQALDAVWICLRELLCPVLVWPLERACPLFGIPRTLLFGNDKFITVKAAVSRTTFIHNFHLPLSTQAHQQLQVLQDRIQNSSRDDGNDQWSYIYGNTAYDATKAYKMIIGHKVVHPAFRWIWRSKCQTQGLLLASDSR